MSKKEEQPQPGDYVWTTDPATGRKRPTIVTDPIQDEIKHPERYATIKNGWCLFPRKNSMPRVDMQDPTVPASAPQQQYSAMINGYSIATVQAENEDAARIAFKEHFGQRPTWPIYEAWFASGSRVALVTERTQESRW